VYAQFLDGDSNTSDTVSATIDYIDAVTIKVSPSDAQVSVGGTVDVDIYAEGAVKVLSARITLSFNPSKIEVTKIKTSGNDFLLTSSGANVITSESEYDNTEGSIVFGVLGQKSGFTGATGDGVLARITFKGKAAGTSYITFVNATENDFILYRYNANNKAFEKYNALGYNGVITIK
jgi:hypothetical protein